MTQHNRSWAKSRFWSRVTVGGPNDCWPWTGPVSKEGYGLTNLDAPERRTVTVHRLAWTLTLGPIPPGMIVRHMCDNRICCNPEHLALGRHEDNMRDMVAHGRARGGRTGGAWLKLSLEDGAQMGREHAAGASVRSLAAKYGMTPPGIRYRLKLLAEGREPR